MNQFGAGRLSQHPRDSQAEYGDAPRDAGFETLAGCRSGDTVQDSNRATPSNTKAAATPSKSWKVTASPERTVEKTAKVEGDAEAAKQGGDRMWDSRPRPPGRVKLDRVWGLPRKGLNRTTNNETRPHGRPPPPPTRPLHPPGNLAGRQPGLPADSTSCPATPSRKCSAKALRPPTSLPPVTPTASMPRSASNTSVTAAKDVLHGDLQRSMHLTGP